MKKFFLFIFVLVSSPAFTQSTHWIKGHAVWNYDWFYPSLNGSLRIETMNDTVIQGRSCQKLKCDTHTKINTGPNGSFIHTIDTEYRFIYFEQDTVWYWKNNGFLVLYDFTASQGQVRLLEPGAENQDCNDSSYLFIDQVYPGNINGSSATFYEVRDSSSNSILQGGVINSHFGMMSTDFGFSHGFFPVWAWCNSQVPNDGTMYKLRCFQDDSLTYNPGNEDCEYYTYLGLTEHAAFDLSIFPNPSSGKIVVSSEVPLSQVRVLSIAGVLLKNIEANQAILEMDLGDLPAGTYFLDLENNSREHVIKPVLISGN